MAGCSTCVQSTMSYWKVLDSGTRHMLISFFLSSRAITVSRVRSTAITISGVPETNVISLQQQYAHQVLRTHTDTPEQPSWWLKVKTGISIVPPSSSIGQSISAPHGPHADLLGLPCQLFQLGDDTVEAIQSLHRNQDPPAFQCW
jgi:hypothetical protein